MLLHGDDFVDLINVNRLQLSLFVLQSYHDVRPAQSLLQVRAVHPVTHHTATARHLLTVFTLHTRYSSWLKLLFALVTY